MSVRKMKDTPVHFDYDTSNDTLYALSNDAKYTTSAVFDDVIIDCDVVNNVAGIEILNASHHFRMGKHELLKPSRLAYTISTDDNNLEIVLELTVMKRNHPLAKSISVTGANDMNLSPSSNSFALA